MKILPTITIVALSLALGTATVDASRATPRRLHKRAVANTDSASSSGATVTYYGGNGERSSLYNPACYSNNAQGKNDYKVDGHVRQPSPNDMVAAVHMASHIAKCGEYVHLSYRGHSVTVKIIDDCSTCHGAWFDLTPAAFKALGISQNTGEAHGVQWSRVNKPAPYPKTRMPQN